MPRRAFGADVLTLGRRRVDRDSARALPACAIDAADFPLRVGAVEGLDELLHEPGAGFPCARSGGMRRWMTLMR